MTQKNNDQEVRVAFAVVDEVEGALLICRTCDNALLSTHEVPARSRAELELLRCDHTNTRSVWDYLEAAQARSLEERAGREEDRP